MLLERVREDGAQYATLLFCGGDDPEVNALMALSHAELDRLAGYSPPEVPNAAHGVIERARRTSARPTKHSRKSMKGKA